MKKLIENNGPIKAPGLPCVKQALAKIVTDLELAGELEKADQARERYKDLTYKDIQLESLIQFPKGRILVCAVVRYRGWLRYDLEVGVADMFDVIKEYAIPIKLLNSEDDLHPLLADKSNLEPMFVYQEWNKTFGFILSDDTQLNSIRDLLCDVAFGKVEYIPGAYDSVTHNTGSVIIDDISVGIEDCLMFFRSDYKPEGPSDDEVVITREPMVDGKTKLVFTLNSKITLPTWAVEVTAPDLEVGEPVIAEDKKSGYVVLSLKPKVYGQGIRSVKGKVTINGVEFEFDKSFQHNPAWVNQYSSVNDINDTLTLNIGYSGDFKANTVRVIGDIDFSYKDIDDKLVEYTTAPTRVSGSGSMLSVRSQTHVFLKPTELNYIFLSDTDFQIHLTMLSAAVLL